MKPTDEQEDILQALLSPSISLVAVNSVAGSGKTSLIVEACNRLNPRNGLYLAYNTSIADEASKKFPNSIICKTTHALAYTNTVKELGLKVGNFNYRSITDKVNYDIKVETTNFIRDFCLSDATSTDDFIKKQATSDLVHKLADKYLDLMQHGKIEVSHEFYLKLYHLMLHNGNLIHDEFDFIALDEFGDINPVTLAIFDLLPAKKKLVVGDDDQNIYEFNGTINGFELIKHRATNLRMTQSFRTCNTIAQRVEAFCRSNLNSHMKFTGITYNDPTIYTRAYITRTNSTLIGKMIELNRSNTPYNLVRKITDIFKLPLALITLSRDKMVTPEFKHYQDDAIEYRNHYRELHDRYSTLFSYLLAKHPDDVNLKSAINLLIKYGTPGILAAYDHAKSHSHKNHSFTLCTAHSSKGLEFDEVTLGDDMNMVLDKFIHLDREERKDQDDSECRLYYVACTRAKKVLHNARHLPTT